MEEHVISMFCDALLLWSVTVWIWSESDLLLSCLQECLSEFLIGVKTTEIPIFQMDTIEQERRNDSWWLTTTATQERNVLSFPSMGPLHDFSSAAVWTDRILFDVSNVSDFHKFGFLDTAAANSCTKIKRQKKYLKMKDYCWVFLTRNQQIQHWKVKRQTKKPSFYLRYDAHRLMQARRNRYLIGELIFVWKWYKKLFLFVLPYSGNCGESLSGLQLRTSVHTDCETLTERHPLITMCGN